MSIGTFPQFAVLFAWTENISPLVWRGWPALEIAPTSFRSVFYQGRGTKVHHRIHHRFGIHALWFLAGLPVLDVVGEPEQKARGCKVTDDRRRKGKV